MNVSSESHATPSSVALDKTITPEGIRVEVGQRWRDTDPRCHGRIIEIERIDELNGLAYYKAGGIRNRIRISRMQRRHTGFELVR